MAGLLAVLWIHQSASVAAIAALSLQKSFLLYEIALVVIRVVAIYAGFFVFESDRVAVLPSA